jgi:subtilisin family serine protease
MAALSNDEDVRRIELNESPKLQMDQTAGTTGVTNIYQGLNLPQAYTGKGVLVGICDSGFDYTHPMFQNADGTTRIRWAWDIYTGRGATEGYLGIGSLYDTPEKLAMACGSIDSLKNHGTHVAGIATGSPVLDGKYRGIAYESDIAMFMSGTSSNNPYDENRTLGDLMIADIKQASSNNIEVDKYYQWDASRTGCLLGIKHFFDYATEQNMPAVMNCSWGGSQNFYFDTSLEEEVFNEMAKVPGHIIVASAGNNSDTDYYRAMKANETLNESLNYLGENAKDESPYSLFITTKGDFEITLSATLTNGNANAVFDSRDPNANGQYC